MSIFKNWKVLLRWFGFPIGAGLLFTLLAEMFLPRELPFLASVDLGFSGIVFGMSIRNTSLVGFVMGASITLLVLFIRYWNNKHVSEAHTLYADYVQNESTKRRNFMRRLDHEIKNPLTGLRAALVNLKEEQTEEQRQRAVGNANRAVERLIRLLTDLRKLSELEERAIEYYPVDVPELLDDVVTAARVNPAYEGREINLLIPKVPSPFPPSPATATYCFWACITLLKTRSSSRLRRIRSKSARWRMDGLLSLKWRIRGQASLLKTSPRFLKSYIAGQMRVAPRAADWASRL